MGLKEQETAPATAVAVDALSYLIFVEMGFQVSGLNSQDTVVDPICLPRAILWIPLSEFSFSSLPYCYVVYINLMCLLQMLIIFYPSVIGKIYTAVEMFVTLDLDLVVILVVDLVIARTLCGLWCLLKT